VNIKITHWLLPVTNRRNAVNGLLDLRGFFPGVGLAVPMLRRGERVLNFLLMPIDVFSLRVLLSKAVFFRFLMSGASSKKPN
jgi:hypothetical protein